MSYFFRAYGTEYFWKLVLVLFSRLYARSLKSYTISSDRTLTDYLQRPFLINRQKVQIIVWLEARKQSCRVHARAFILSEFRQCNAISQSKYSSCLKLKFQGNHGAPHQDQTITCGISLDAFLQTFPLSLLLRIFNTETILTSGKHDTGHR